MHERHIIFYGNGQLYQYRPSYATVSRCSAALPCYRPLDNGPVMSYSRHQSWPLYVIWASQHRITTRVVDEPETNYWRWWHFCRRRARACINYSIAGECVWCAPRPHLILPATTPLSPQDDVHINRIKIKQICT